jgi:quercetin dioxygenase-like cupin family protein
MRSTLTVVVALLVLVGLWTPLALAQSGAVGTAGAGTLVVKPVVEKKVDTLPAGPLFWRVETFATLAQAQAAAGPLSLAGESNGKAWLFTLGPAGGSSSGGTKMVELGPIPEISASQYLLRINEASGPPGSITPVHSHPGSEAAYVLVGEQSFRTPHGVKRIAAGHAEVGHGPDTPMQASNSGSVDLRALIMFVVDATKPFSKPATMP